MIRRIRIPDSTPSPRAGWLGALACALLALLILLSA
jgi:hypothetical protein